MTYNLPPLPTRMRAGALAAGPVISCVLAWLGAAPVLAAEPEQSRSWTFTPDASARVRYEYLHDRYARGFDGSDRIVQTQVRAGFRAGYGPISIRLEALDGANFLPGPDTEAGSEPTSSTELLNAYARLSLNNDTLRVDAGRFTFDLGSRRLLAQSGSSNFPARFDGVRAVWSASEAWTLTAFETRVGRRDLQTIIGSKPLPARPEQAFGGLHAAWSDPAAPAQAETYWFRLRESGGHRLDTHGLRVWREPSAGAMDGDLEVMVQSGRTQAGGQRIPVRAYGLDMQAGYTFDRPWRTRLAAHYIYASGDDASDPGQIQRFNPLFGSRSGAFGGGGSLFGPLDRENISAAGLSVDARRDAWRITLRYFNVRLASATDRWRRADLRDASGASGRAIGDLVDVRVDRQWLDGRLRGRLGAGVLSKGQFARTAPGAPGNGVSAGVFAELSVRY